jgi:adenosylcobinamide-phosphate synthase
MSASVILAALLLDRLLGEPRRFHPLVGFGNAAYWLEHRMLLLGPADNQANIYCSKRLSGIVACFLLVAPPVLCAALFIHLAGDNKPLGWLLEVMILYLATGARSLEQHALRVKFSLAHGDIQQARQDVACLVSRDTAQLDETGINKAAIESILENGSDAIFAPCLWYLIAGAPGVVAYRLVNTLDAMWGYRNDRYRDFGCAAARLDDVLNWIPARITALSYALSGNFRTAMHSWREQAQAWDSPNAGPVMASGAGALELELGGAASYHGQTRTRPVLGAGKLPERQDIERAIRLIRRTMFMWIMVITAGSVMLWIST